MNSKLHKAWSDFARQNSGTIRSVDEVSALTSVISKHFGTESMSHKNIRRLGELFLIHNLPSIFVPVCPDYSHTNGVYDFRSLNDGVSLVTQLHLDWLRKFKTELKFKVIFLVADQEAKDLLLCDLVRENQESFAAKVTRSILATRELVEPLGFQCFAMTDYFPDLISLEEHLVQSIEPQRLDNDTLARSGMYDKLGVQSWKDRRSRTANTLAQYIAFARLVLQKGGIILNHSTVNLRAYKDEGVPFIHNPVKVY